MFKFNLGDKAKDTITGFEGIITSRTEFKNGCIRYGLQSTRLKEDGSTMEAEHFDEQDLVLIKTEEKKEEQGKRLGGPRKSIPKYTHK